MSNVWPTYFDDARAYQARSLLEQLRDTGPVGKRVPLCVVTAMRAAAAEIELLQRLADYLDDPQVLLAIPQPHRMRLSELLHQSTTTQVQPAEMRGQR